MFFVAIFVLQILSWYKYKKDHITKVPIYTNLEIYVFIIMYYAVDSSYLLRCTTCQKPFICCFIIQLSLHGITFNYLAFQSFDLSVHDEDYSRNVPCALNLISTFERTRWRLFQKRAVRTKSDIDVWAYTMKIITETCRAH